MKGLFFSLILSFSLAGLVACGDVYADPESGVEGIAAVATADAGSSVPSPACPASRPRENTSCGAIGQTCEYGETADPRCNTVLACRGAAGDGYWDPTASETCFRNACPAIADVATIDGQPCSLPAGNGATSDADEAVCNMNDGVCACSTGRDGAHAHSRLWVCVRPISVCPPNRPFAGSTCSGTLYCDYGSCSFKRGLLMECLKERWVTGGATCP